MLDLEPIKARLAVATPGPWHVEPEDTACGSFVARMPGIYIEPEHQHLAPAGNDAALIANAPADIAALVAEVERLTKVLTALVDDSEGQQHRLAWQDACEVVYGHRGPEVG